MVDRTFRGAGLPDRPGMWDVIVRDGVIRHVVPTGATTSGLDSADDVVAVDGGLLSRTFVDVHLHLDKAFQGEDVVNHSGTLAEAIGLSAQITHHRGTHEQQVARILRGAMTALAHGTTVLRSHIDVDHTTGLAGVDAALAARALLPKGLRLELVAFPQQGIDAGVLDLLRESLLRGCDAIGGIPALDADPASHIRQVFALAAEHQVAVDMHIDESDDPDDNTLALLAEETVRFGWEGRVIAGHCCSLVAQRPEVRKGVIEMVRDAGVHVVTLPSTNLHLQGRDDAVPRRGLAPVAELLAGGVNVVYASDNIRDAFNPFGNASMVESGLLLAHAAHMGGRAQLSDVFDMATTRAVAALTGTRWTGALPPQVAVGMPADLLVFPVPTVQEVIVGQVHPVAVYLSGERVVARREGLDVVPHQGGDVEVMA